MSTRRALSFTGLGQAVSFVLGLGSVVIISRLLTPEEIGVFSVSVALLGFAHIIREFGVDQYLIQTDRVDNQRFRAAFTVAVTVSWSIAGVLYLLRIPMAAFYGHEGIKDVLALVSINFLIMPFGTPLLAMIRRELQFGRLALVGVISTFVHALVTVTAAYLGESYLSMAWGGIAQHLTSAIVLNFMRPGEIFVLPSLRGVKEILHFGSVASLASFVNQVGNSAPDLVLGRTLGFSAVAYYSRALGLKNMSMDNLARIVRLVHFPTFSEKIRNNGDPRALYREAVIYLFAISAPVLAVLAVLSEPLILFLFGDQWQASAKLATLICLYSILTVPYLLYGVTLTAMGHIALYLRSEIKIQAVKVAILMSSIWVTLDQVVMLLGLAFAFEAYTAQRAMRQSFGFSLPDILGVLKSGLVLVPFATVGPLAVVFFGPGDSTTAGAAVSLGLAGLTSAAGWIVGIFGTNSVLKPEIILILRKLKLLNASAVQGRDS